MQITTNTQMDYTQQGCLCYCKGTNFYANHNQVGDFYETYGDVYAIAKVLIFMQITTEVVNGIIDVMMFMLLQRY